MPKILGFSNVMEKTRQGLAEADQQSWELKFILNAAAKFCVEIATHWLGRCVLQRCISHSTGEHCLYILFRSLIGLPNHDSTNDKVTIESAEATLKSCLLLRCILESAEGDIICLSADHRLESNEEERDRVTACGGEVGRLNTGGGTEGGIIQCHQGKWQFGYTMKIIALEAASTELIAIREGLTAAWDKGIRCKSAQHFLSSISSHYIIRNLPAHPSSSHWIFGDSSHSGDSSHWISGVSSTPLAVCLVLDGSWSSKDNAASIVRELHFLVGGHSMPWIVAPSLEELRMA
uniref:Uncharacterized protein n=1 Tax=Chenopodium quinoa TaxID=63459 RepID=A0A803MXX2_CHEQI